jgi:hypothetical protein
MNIREMIESSKKFKLDEEQIKALKNRLESANLMFEEESKKKSVTEKFLNKRYTI